MSQYFTLLTDVGAAKLANATALGQSVQLEKLAVGDGNGVLPTPKASQTSLINERRKEALNSVSIDENNANYIICEQVIPESEGGYYIREIGIFDDAGDLIAVGNFPETYKPILQEGSGRTQTIRCVIMVNSSDTTTVELKIDPSVVLATREYVDKESEALKEFSSNASNLKQGKVPLAALPVGAENGLDADKLDGVEGINHSKFYHYVILEDSGTTELFIDELKSKFGCFKGSSVTLKVYWNYTIVSDLDTGDEHAGIIELAGCVIETWGDMNTKNIRITRPNTGIGGKRICIYNDQGEGYLPGWEVIWSSGLMGENSGLDADLLDGRQGSEYLIDLTGSIHLYATAIAPIGFLKANGAEVSRTSYAKLFEKLGTTYGEGNGSTTFNIPDVRGDFLRCNDDGRGVDWGRVLGSWQSDENKAHAHIINGQNRFLGDVNGDSSFDAVSGHATGDDGNWFSMPLSGGGSEARPRNTSLLAYIKY